MWSSSRCQVNVNAFGGLNEPVRDQVIRSETLVSQSEVPVSPLKLCAPVTRFEARHGWVAVVSLDLQRR